MINFLLQLAADGVHRKHFTFHSLSHRGPKRQTHSAVTVQFMYLYTRLMAMYLEFEWNLKTIRLSFFPHTYMNDRHSSLCYDSPFACSCFKVSAFSALKTQSHVSVVRAENGPESCLKWGTEVYKKHAHLLKDFIGKRLIVPLRCFRLLQVFFFILKVSAVIFFKKRLKVKFHIEARLPVPRKVTATCMIPF